ncbi:MAG: hypothetical protein JNK55_17765 [Rubrivivax sp.]|jgi:cytochrome b561|nr:hypothetical protein [Rubrivivax sp.]
MAFGGTNPALQSFDALVNGSERPADFKTYTPQQVHGLVAKLRRALVALHVSAALCHQLVLRDGLLGRPRPGTGD